MMLKVPTGPGSQCDRTKSHKPLIFSGNKKCIIYAEKDLGVLVDEKLHMPATCT